MESDYIEACGFPDIKPYVPEFDSVIAMRLAGFPARLTNFLKQEMMSGFRA